MKRIEKSWICVLAVLPIVSVPVHAQTARKKAQSAEPQQIADSGAIIEPGFRMRFKDAPWDYEIRVALPGSYYKSDKAYPVVWVTDGSVRFDRAVSTVNFSSSVGELPELIVVSIGNPAEAAEQFAIRRTHDFTAKTEQCTYSGPGKDLYQKACRDYYDKIPRYALGGAPKFLAFIVSDIRAAIKKKYRVTDDHTLFGNSGGGLFCGYALLTQPTAFSKYICGSPAFGELFGLEEKYAKTHGDLKAKVFFGAGDGEVLEGGLVSALGVVSSMSRMAEILKLRAYPSLVLHVRIFPELKHGPVTADNNLYWGLRTLFSSGSSAVAH